MEMKMDSWQKIANAIAELQEDGQLEVFIGDFSAGFEVGVDSKGVYLSLCPHCVGEAVGNALGAEEEAAPTHKELH
jgi:hypothetical protein